MMQHYQTYFGSLIERCYCDLSILDYNYVRWKTFIGLYRSAYLRIVGAQSSTDLQYHLHVREYSQLLEFYLQMDVELFNMKTCSFRQAQTRSLDEGIFCIDVSY
jgi:hypothetical protein